MMLPIRRLVIVVCAAFAAALVLVPFDTRSLWSVFASPAAVDSDASSPRGAMLDRTELTIKECVVVAEEVKATPRISGILVEREGARIRLGQVVEQGEVLGVVDDAKAEKVQQTRSLAIKTAEATHGVAEAEYTESLDIIRRSPGAIPKMQRERQRLTMERAEHEVTIAAIREEIATLKVDWHRVVAPRRGIVVQIDVVTGEWVKKGKPVARIVNLEEVWIEGYLDADTISPKGLAGKPITFRVNGNGDVQVEGKVTFISPVIQAGNKRRIMADVINRQENGHWLLASGMKGEMTIHLQN